MSDIALVEQVLAGDAAAVRRLVDALSPVVHARVARILTRRAAGARGRDVRQELEDLAQEVFVALFERRGRLLAAWAPDRGLSLANYVGLIAERRTISALRSRRQSPWTEDPTEDTDLGRAAGGSPGFERRVVEQDLLRAVLDELRAGLSAKGLRLFELLMIEQRSVDEICAEMEMQPAAVYAWRSRLARRAREIRAGLTEAATPRTRGGAA